MSLTSFLSVALRDLRVGAVMPSSRHAVKKILAAAPVEAKEILEYGPGDGVLTRRLLERLPADGRLLAIETNARFAALLGALDDPRFTLVRGDAREASVCAEGRGLARFDLVVSGIPFSLLSDADRWAMVVATHRFLRPGGVFIVYQTLPLMLPYLRRAFDTTMRIELRNIPPYFIMKAVKK